MGRSHPFRASLLRANVQNAGAFCDSITLLPETIWREYKASLSRPPYHWVGVAIPHISSAISSLNSSSLYIDVDSFSLVFPTDGICLILSNDYSIWMNILYLLGSFDSQNLGFQIMSRVIAATIFIALVSACTHPIDIIGSGHIESHGTHRNCVPDNAPCLQVIAEDYHESYVGYADIGWEFARWEGCFEISNLITYAGRTCSFDIYQGIIEGSYGKTMPALTAVFVPKEFRGDGIEQGSGGHFAIDHTRNVIFTDGKGALTTPLLSVDVITGNRQSIANEASTLEFPLQPPTGIAIDEAGNVYWAERQSKTIYTIDPNTGITRILAKISLDPEFRFDPAIEGICYLERTKSIYVNLQSNVLIASISTVTGEVTIIPEVFDEDGPGFSDSRGTIDCQNNYANLITTSANGTINSFDVETGQTQTILSRTLGAGPTIVPNRMSLSIDGLTAYVYDLVLTSIFAVDLATGDRQIISGPNTGSGNVIKWVKGIDTLDQNTLILSVGRGSQHDIGLIAVDVNTGDRTLVSGI